MRKVLQKKKETGYQFDSFANPEAARMFVMEREKFEERAREAAE